jgi:hypothetical protein
MYRYAQVRERESSEFVNDLFLLPQYQTANLPHEIGDDEIDPNHIYMHDEFLLDD